MLRNRARRLDYQIMR
ncbi:hypothetical protein ABEL74_06420 [Escherichia coli]